MINFEEVKYESYDAMIKDLVDIVKKTCEMEKVDVKKVYEDLGWYLDRENVGISRKEFEELLITKGRYLELRDRGGYNPYGIGSITYGSNRAGMTDSTGATL